MIKLTHGPILNKRASKANDISEYEMTSQSMDRVIKKTIQDESKGNNEP